MTLNLSLQKLDHYSIFIVCIYIIKISFTFFALYYTYLTFGKLEKDVEKDDSISWVKLWKDRTELLFVFLMSSMLLYLFFPFGVKQRCIDDTHTRNLLFIYAIVIFITTDWHFFVYKSGAFDIMKKVK